ncbi:DUF397 domain-containing protein [Actinophytocola gossypii]|uniref:DUF397 domain-containing protein n=1 Tax=Actinophytocola gossypii TaxID=2812003 RepID=A0ABT2JGP2_9PSEU|nr:DUF397 domain-containing protein [Actinophytocola gossypii]MCT2587040.1 DUF397 domain-containing protein [Actinophytocola gossypii]
MADNTTWRTSSVSGGNGGSSCVEIAITPNVALVRDSKNRSGAALSFTGPEWRAFVIALSGRGKTSAQ